MSEKRALFWTLAQIAQALQTATGKPVILEGDTAPALPYIVLREVSDPSVSDWRGEAYRVGRVTCDSFALKASEAAALDDAACELMASLGWDRVLGLSLGDPANPAIRRRVSDFTALH